MKDYTQMKQDLSASRDRITNILKSQADSQSLPTQVGDISQSLLSAISQGTGAAGFQQGMEQKQGSRLQSETSLYNLMQQEIDQGNEDAAFVDKAIKDITGNDTEGYESIANIIHQSPDPVDRRNATISVMKAANKLGYKPKMDSKTQAEIDLKKAQAKFYNSKSSKSSDQNVDPVLARQTDKDIIVKTRQAASGASDSLRSLESIENALFDKNGKPKVKTGKTRAGAQFVGQVIPGVDSATYQDVQSKSTRLSLDVASMLKGQTSDKDVARSLLTAPGYDREPEANKKIIKDQKAALRVVAEMPKFVSSWRNKYGSTLGVDENGMTFDEAYLDWQSARFRELGGTSGETESNFADLSDEEILNNLSE